MFVFRAKNAILMVRQHDNLSLRASAHVYRVVCRRVDLENRMPCRDKNKHKGRNHTHAVKPASKKNLTPVPGTFRALPPLVVEAVAAPVAAPVAAKAPKAPKAEKAEAPVAKKPKAPKAEKSAE